MKKYIENHEMANYLNNALNSEIIKKIISSAPNTETAQTYFQKLGNILEKYYISTMDNSLEGINLVARLFINNYLTNNNFDNEYVNLLINRIAKINGLQLVSLKDKINIIELINQRNKNNPFYTHCFPGSLYDTVSKEGLNIANEMFHHELSILERYSKTPYKYGKLCYCEFSEASLSYANFSVPERIRNALGGISSSNQDESKYELYKRKFEEHLKELLINGKIEQDSLYDMYLAGKRIIDFYCTNKDSCIAVFRKNSSNQVQDRSIITRIHLELRNLRGTFIGNKIEDIIKKCKNNQEEAGNILESKLVELEKIFPNIRKIAENIINEGLQKCTIRFALSNYEHGGFADGYEIESGKLSKQEFAIVKCPCPTDLWYKFKNDKSMHIEPPKQLINDDNYNLELETKHLSIISKILETAIKTNSNPDIIECIQEENKCIPIYFYKNNLIFPNNYLIQTKEANFIISIFSKKQLENKCVANIIESITDETLIKNIVEKFKETDEYDEDYHHDIENLKLDAIYWYSQNLFYSYDESTKENMIKEEAINNDIISIKIEEDKYIVKTKEKTQNIPRNILVNNSDIAQYNNLYLQILEDNKNKKRK